MNRLQSFAAGIITAVVVAAVSGIRGQAATMVALGFAVAVILAVSCLSSALRLHAAAARLEHIARWIDAKPPVRETRRAGRATPGDEDLRDSREPELVSALMNLGSRKPAATAAARYAITAAPKAATITDLVRIALRAPQVAA